MDVFKKVGVGFRKRQHVVCSLYDAELLGLVFIVVQGNELLDDDEVVGVVNFYFCLVVGIEYVLSGQEVNPEVLAQFPDGFGVLQPVNLYPVDGIILQQGLQCLQVLAAGSFDPLAAIAVKVQVGGSGCFSRVFQLFAQQVVLFHVGVSVLNKGNEFFRKAFALPSLFRRPAG